MATAADFANQTQTTVDASPSFAGAAPPVDPMKAAAAHPPPGAAVDFGYGYGGTEAYGGGYYSPYGRLPQQPTAPGALQQHLAGTGFERYSPPRNGYGTTAEEGALLGARPQMGRGGRVGLRGLDYGWEEPPVPLKRRPSFTPGRVSRVRRGIVQPPPGAVPYSRSTNAIPATGWEPYCLPNPDPVIVMPNPPQPRPLTAPGGGPQGYVPAYGFEEELGQSSVQQLSYVPSAPYRKPYRLYADPRYCVKGGTVRDIGNLMRLGW